MSPTTATTRRTARVSLSLAQFGAQRRLGQAAVGSLVCRRRDRPGKGRSGMRASEATNRALLQAMPDLMLRHSKDGVYLGYSCQPGTRLLMPPEAFLGRRMEDVLPPYIAEPALECLRRTLRLGGVQEYRVLGGSGRDAAALRSAIGGLRGRRSAGPRPEHHRTHHHRRAPPGPRRTAAEALGAGAGRHLSVPAVPRRPDLLHTPARASVPCTACHPRMCDHQPSRYSIASTATTTTRSWRPSRNLHAP